MGHQRPHITHVVGARPNFPKAAPVLDALKKHDVDQSLVHTGQHYDQNLSDIFLEQLGMPAPDVNLGVGSGTHAEQTGALMIGLEKLFGEQRPDLVVVYGDVNSTVAAAMVAAKLGIQLAHVEAGLRSFDRTMPEEINRIIVDRLSNLHLTTSVDAIAHLAHEGTPEHQIHFVGNPMIDTVLRFRDAASAELIRTEYDLPSSYIVLTLHRPGNVGSPDQVAEIVKAMHAVADQTDVITPLHPRGRKQLSAAGLLDHPRIRALDPLGYKQFLGLVQGSAAVITDSGGIQEETTVLGIRCFTLRPNTERPVTIHHGTNRLVDAVELAQVVSTALADGPLTSWPVPPLWDGRAGERIAQVLAESVGRT